MFSERWRSIGAVARAPSINGVLNQPTIGGDRRIVMVRTAHDPKTKAYFNRRLKAGASKHEVIRILKRYVAREVYRLPPYRLKSRP